MTESSNPISLEELSEEIENKFPVSKDALRYDSAITVEGDLDQTWEWIRRFGWPKEGHAGLLFPRSSKVDKGGAFTPEERDQLTPLQEGDFIRDSTKKRNHQAEVVRVADITDGGHSIVFKSKWDDREDGSKGWDYTFQFVVEKGSQDGTTRVRTITRWDNVRHKHVTALLAPIADRLFMNRLRKGLNQRIRYAHEVKP